MKTLFQSTVRNKPPSAKAALNTPPTKTPKKRTKIVGIEFMNAMGGGALLAAVLIARDIYKDGWEYFEKVIHLDTPEITSYAFSGAIFVGLTILYEARKYQQDRRVSDQADNAATLNAIEHGLKKQLAEIDKRHWISQNEQLKSQVRLTNTLSAHITKEILRESEAIRTDISAMVSRLDAQIEMGFERLNTNMERKFAALIGNQEDATHAFRIDQNNSFAKAHATMARQIQAIQTDVNLQIDASLDRMEEVANLQTKKLLNATDAAVAKIVDAERQSIRATDEALSHLEGVIKNISDKTEGTVALRIDKLESNFDETQRRNACKYVDSFNLAVREINMATEQGAEVLGAKIDDATDKLGAQGNAIVKRLHLLTLERRAAEGFPVLIANDEIESIESEVTE